jgi:hypothetical protein
LCALAFGEQRQSLPQDQRLEVIGGLMRRERGLIGKQLIEDELRRILLRAGNLKQPGSRFGLRLGQKPM